MDSVYDRADHPEVIIPSFSEIGTRLHLENVKSCVGIGSGSGRIELPCLERCMPNLTKFTAVEPDPESAYLVWPCLEVNPHDKA